MGSLDTADEAASNMIGQFSESEPIENGTTVSAGLVITNDNGQQQYASGMSTDVHFAADGTARPKEVTGNLQPTDNGTIVHQNQADRLTNGPGLGTVEITVGERADVLAGGVTETDSGFTSTGPGHSYNRPVRGPGSNGAACNNAGKPWNPNHPPRRDPDPSFQVFVRNLDGRTLTISGVRASDRVERLKEKIQEKNGIPPSQQRLTFEGKNLHDGHELSEFGVRPESTLFLQGRLRGG